MKLGAIVIHCCELKRMLLFWQNALHYLPAESVADDRAVLRDPEGKGPDLSLLSRERLQGKQRRMYLELYTTDIDTEVDRLVKLGASRYPWWYGPHADYAVMEDPEGNLFYVVQVSQQM